MTLNPANEEALNSFNYISDDYNFSECSEHFESAGGSDNFFEAVKEACSEPIKEEPLDNFNKDGDSKVDAGSYFRCNCLSLVHEADLILHSACCSFFQPYVLIEKFRDYEFLEAKGLKLPRSPIKLRLRKCRKGKASWALANSILNKAFKMSSGEADATESTASNTPSETQEDSHASLSTPTPADLQSPSQSFSTGPPLPDSDDSPFGDIPNFELSDIFGKTNNDSADGEAPQTNGIASPTPSPTRSDPAPDSKPENEEKVQQSEGGESSSEKTSTQDSTENKSSPPQPNPTSRIRMRPMDDLMATSEVKVEENAGPLSALNVMISDLKNPHTVNKTFEQIPVLPPNVPSMTPVMPPMAATILPPVIPSPPMASSSPVMAASPVAVPNLPSGVSLQKRPPPPSFPTGVTITKQPRRDSESSSTSSLSPSATPPPPRLPEGITLVRPGQTKQQDPVANLLASRGVSVVSSQGQTSLKKVTANPPPPQVRNSGALTITTASPNKRPRPGAPVMASIDLTDDSAPVRRQAVVGKPRAPAIASMVRPRGPGSSTVTCDVCDKVFAHAEALRQHMQTHAPGRRPMGPGGAQMANNIRQGTPTTNGVPQGGANSFPCRFCIARYPNQLALSQHMQRFHPDKFGGSVGSEFALPVVDLSDNRAMNSLVSLGIKFCIPLGNLTREEGGGMYGVPVVPMDGATNPAVCNLGRLSCSNLLPIGPMKSVMRP